MCLQVQKAEKEIEAFQEQILVVSKEKVHFQEAAELAKRQASAATSELQTVRGKAAEGCAAADSLKARVGELSEQLATANSERASAEHQAAVLGQELQHLSRDAEAMKVCSLHPAVSTHTSDVCRCGAVADVAQSAFVHSGDSSTRQRLPPLLHATLADTR